MAFDREAAKRDGYTDDEINAYLQAEAKKAKAPTPVTTDVGEPPAPTTQITPVETSAGSVATQVGLAAAPYAGSAALGAGGLYGAKVLKQGFNAMRDANATRMAQVEAQNAATQGLQQRFEQRMAGQAGQGVAQAARPVAPVAPAAPAAPAPVAPTAVSPVQPAAAAAEQGIMSRASDIVRKLALDKIVPGVAKAGVGAGLMAYSPELGPKVPGVGRMKGMEINPLTGRPWTPDQIAQYESNSAMFDQQLAAPQMRR